MNPLSIDPRPAGRGKAGRYAPYGPFLLVLLALLGLFYQQSERASRTSHPGGRLSRQDEIAGQAMGPPRYYEHTIWPHPLMATGAAPRRPGLLGLYYRVPAQEDYPGDRPASLGGPALRGSAEEDYQPFPMDGASATGGNRLLLRRVDPLVDFNWDTVPPPRVPHDYYRVRWTGLLYVPRSGRYELEVEADDGVRLNLDGQRLIEDWVIQPPTREVVGVVLQRGWHPLRLDYFQAAGGASVHLRWNYPFGSGRRVVSPSCLGHR